MSVRYLPHCRRDLGLGLATKAILIALCDHANDDGVTWVGDEALADYAECSRRAVFNALGKLRERGIIARERLEGRTVWRITIPDASAPPAPPSAPPALVPPATSAPPASNGARRSESSAPGAPESSVNRQEASLGDEPPSLTLVPPPSSKSSRKRPAVPLPADLVLTDAMRDFAAERGMPRSVMDHEFRSFLDWAEATGARYSNWQAAWRTRASNYRKFNGGRRAAPDGEVIYR